MKRTYSDLFCLFLIILFTGSGCSKKIDIDPVQKLESYNFSQTVPVMQRVTSPPAVILNYLKKLDNRDDYTVYTPDKNEKNLIRMALTELPPLNRSIIEKRCIGIYFINDFLGNGLTEWVVDKNGDIYGFMVFDSSVLRKNISELLTEKEMTCYKINSSNYSISIDCGKEKSGLLYILLHESTHLVDYVKRITPFADDGIKKVYSSLSYSPDQSTFTRSIWIDYNVPVKRYSFTDKVFFYGMEEPKLNISNASKIYDELSESPFISLYGSMNWAEDLAEMLTFYHVTNRLKISYTINIFEKEKIAFSVKPITSALVQKRFSSLDRFYRTK